MPIMVAEAASDGAWLVESAKVGDDGKTRVSLFGDHPYTVHLVRDVSRHTKARAYRGNALTAILPSQRAIVAWMKERS
jgi:hypothetical protein